jgi:uncharacterized membrane protein SpoIIM required for sporulation
LWWRESMPKLFQYVFIIFTIILSVFGFYKLVYSVENGTASANEYLAATMGGSMDSQQFQMVLEGYILNNIVLGGIMFLVGLVFLCISLYNLIFKESK